MACQRVAIICCVIVALLVTPEVLSQSNDQPSFSVTPSDTTAVQGFPVTFYCTIANRGSHLVFWNINQRSAENAAGKDFTLGPNTNTHNSYPRFQFVGDPGMGEYNLQVANVTSLDTGSYTCLVSDPRDSASSALEAGAILSVVDKAVVPQPEFFQCNGTPKPNAQGEYEEGDTLSLTCSSMGGIPLPSLSWARVKGNNVVEDLPSQTIVQDDFVTTTARVELSSIDHQSYFRCTESHPARTSAERSCTDDDVSGPQNLLKVRFEPKVTVSPKIVGVQLLETISVELTCKAYGYPAITLGPRIILPLNKTSEPVPTSELGTTAIRVELTTDDVGKDFYCRATNEIGVGEDRMEIQRLGALPTWLILVIIGAIAAVVLIFFVVVGCILCVDRSNLEDDKQKDRLRYSVNRSRPTTTREAGDGDFIEVYDEEMAPIEDFQGGQESIPFDGGPKEASTSNDFETGEKGPRYQNLNEAFQSDEANDGIETFQRDSVHSNSLSQSYPSSEPIMDPDFE